MLFGNSLEKKFGPKIERALKYSSLLSGCSFSALPDRSFISYQSEELANYMLRKLGGDYEGSFSVTYYKEGKLNVECYFSRARGGIVYPALSAAVGACRSKFDRVDLARQVPGETSTCFGLWLEKVNEDNFDESLGYLIDAVQAILGCID